MDGMSHKLFVANVNLNSDSNLKVNVNNIVRIFILMIVRRSAGVF